MRLLVLFFSVLVATNGFGQSFNMDFEKVSNDGGLPDGWFKWGNYKLSADTLSYEGSFAARITSDSAGGSFGSIAFRIPAGYSGSSIKLEGYMKLEGVEGFAGLLLRLDAGGSSIVFDNMQRQRIHGTRDWEKYAITLRYSEDAEEIYVAGLLAGKGKVWFDNFVLTIDSNDIQTIKRSALAVSGADLDTAFSQGSQVTFPALTDERVRNLELLGRIWGFLKYYHPNIAKGDYNWDNELFRLLPEYIHAWNNKKRDALLSAWISRIGEVAICHTCAPAPDSAVLKPNLSWISDSNLKPKLKEQLLHVYQNRNQGKHYYVRQLDVGNPDFPHENAYGQMSYPDAGFRLLALYRYWNIIEYFCPNRHVMDRNWDDILPAFIPMFIAANDELAYESAAVQLIGAIQDTHANLWDGGDGIEAWKGRFYPPIHVRFVEDKLVVTDYYKPELKKEVGLEIGDVITRINGKAVDELVQAVSKFYPASNEAAKMRDISADLLRSDLTGIDVEYVRDSTVLSTYLRLYEPEVLNIYRWYRRDIIGNSYKILTGNIGYITLGSIKHEDIDAIKRDLKDTKGIIIDIRNYPTAFVPFALGTYFTPVPVPFVKFTQFNMKNPGEFMFVNQLIIPASDNAYKGKLVVLVNELTQSQAEYTAMAFRATPNCTIVGSTTAGADGNVSTIMLPGGLRTMISGIGIFYPDGQETQRIGIVPDVVVHPTVAGIRDGRDEVLEKAISIVNLSQ
jgi:C-terminal processing protease CtpA/Prc